MTYLISQIKYVFSDYDLVICFCIILAAAYEHTPELY